MADGMRPNSSAQLLFGFVAGLLATVIFHQLALTLLWIIGVAPSLPFPMAPTRPFGVPAVLFIGILGRCLGYLICAGSTSLSSRRLLGCGISFWRHPAVLGCSYGGFTAQGKTHGRRLASASAADGIFNQRRMGYRHRAHSQAFNQLVQRSRKTNADSAR